MDPYFEIDIPRVASSYDSAMARKKYRCRLGDNKTPASVRHFFRDLGEMCKTREDKKSLRGAMVAITSLLDRGNYCYRSHCEHCDPRHAMNCSAGKNPKRCQVNQKYLARKAEREAAKQAT